MRKFRVLRGVLRAAWLAGLAAATPPAFADGHQFPLPPKDWPKPVDDTVPQMFLLGDRIEYQARRGTDARIWDVQGWIGGDYDKLWLKSEGAVEAGRTRDAEVQALYARRIAPFWYLQTGLRYDDKPLPSRTFGVLALQGLAPQWFNVEASAFLSKDGNAWARLEAEYELLFTQRLILQPRIETNFAFSRVESAGVGRGFNDVEFGLRLRYEIRREFAPYIGVNWNRKLGDTADLFRRGGEDVKNFSIVAGIRLWY